MKISLTSVSVGDQKAALALRARLRDLGVRFTRDPVEAAGVRYAVFDDTCGNLIQIYQQTG